VVFSLPSLATFPSLLLNTTTHTTQNTKDLFLHRMENQKKANGQNKSELEGNKSVVLTVAYLEKRTKNFTTKVKKKKYYTICLE